MTRDEQIEIVAQAIRNSFIRRIKDSGSYARPWPMLPDGLRKQFTDEAKAAIEAYESTIALHGQQSPAAVPSSAADAAPCHPRSQQPAS